MEGSLTISQILQPRIPIRKPILFHHGSRGSAEPIRLLLEYLRFDYASTKIADNSYWEIKKREIQPAFDSLPMYYNGSECISEIEAIMFHICYEANRQDLLGRDTSEIVLLRAIGGVIHDAREVALRLIDQPRSPLPQKTQKALKIQSEQPKKKQKEQKERSRLELVSKLDQLSLFLGEKTFLAEEISYCDFFLYELIQLLNTIDTNFITIYPNFQTFVNLIDSIPSIADYHSSGRFCESFQHQILMN
eukprot:TRINITY_DN6006_c0_g2_i1.p1 TRINITY_DN6006_c0_g2~~TRINITY_DN6006_c0_g2_i1.p1  ORF type:complete len:248 (+),score=27.87 TRINITY_DN6006_c0_g2_i1:380-1123(+)